MSKMITIGNKKIGYNYPCFIIAEAGVNHNGELNKALALVDVAADAGADVVKFQTYRPEDVVIEKGEMAEYQKKNLGKVTSQLEMIRGFWLDEDYYPQIIERCNKRGIIFMSTPHGGKKSVDFLETLNVPAYKVGSGDLTNYILLNRVAQTGKPVILSSGMATMDEVKKAIGYIRSKGNNQIAALHCTTNYPCPAQEVNLRAMVTMMDKLDVPIGFSDHTDSDSAGIAAAALGMAIYECHFTLDKSLPGPDHIASAEPNELKRRIRFICDIEVILGLSEKKPNDSEIKSMKGLVRRSVVVTSDLPAGYVLGEVDLEAKRPGGGTSPAEYEKFLGKKLKSSVKKNYQITFDDVE